MSQKKVDQYKEYKKNKKEILKKEKRRKAVGNLIKWLVIILVCGTVLAYAGVAGAKKYAEYKASQPDYDRTTYVLGDMAGVLEESTEAEETEGAKEEETTAESSETEAEESVAEETAAETESAAQ